MQVQVGVVPGAGLQTVALGSAATVNDALVAAGLQADGFTISVNGIPSSLTNVLNEGERVILTKNAKGN